MNNIFLKWFLSLLFLVIMNGIIYTDSVAQTSGAWIFSRDGINKWEYLNSSNTTVNKVHLADFNNDDRADVFSAWGGHWYVSYSGTGRWQQINTSNRSVSQVRLADFNNDGRADVFSAWGGHWYVSYSGTGRWQQINTSNRSVGQVRLADFNNDDRADVFSAWGGHWYVSYSGTGRWQKINTSNRSVSQVRLADFTDDGNADVFANSSQKIHELQVRRFTTANITNAEADMILRDATNTLRTLDGGEDVSCLACLIRNGNITNFATGNGIINSQADFNAVNNLNGNVKVVNQINWCGGIIPNIIGCASMGGDSFIVVRFTTNLEGILWLHEFGHNQGIQGDYNIPNRVMNGTININNRRVTKSECAKFRD